MKLTITYSFQREKIQHLLSSDAQFEYEKKAFMGEKTIE